MYCLVSVRPNIRLYHGLYYTDGVSFDAVVGVVKVAGYDTWSECSGRVHTGAFYWSLQYITTMASTVLRYDSNITSSRLSHFYH